MTDTKKKKKHTLVEYAIKHKERKKERNKTYLHVSDRSADVLASCTPIHLLQVASLLDLYFSAKIH